MELYQGLLAEFPILQVLAKGGVRNFTHIKTLKKIGIQILISIDLISKVVLLLKN